MADNRPFQRRSIRLQGYDYSTPGAYFVTICTYQRECFLGEVTGETVQLSEHGALVQKAWNNLPAHYASVELDAFVLMPNHIHGIVFLNDEIRAGLRPAPTKAKPSPLSEVIRGFKSFSARQINQLQGTPGSPVWQRSYYEHIIRNEEALNTIQQYILSNPSQWTIDKENPLHWGV